MLVSTKKSRKCTSVDPSVKTSDDKLNAQW
jgi:hypothetical protein